MTAILVKDANLLQAAKRFTAPEFGEFPARATPLGLDVPMEEIRFSDVELLNLYKERTTPSEADLKAHPPEFFSARISTDEMDSYFTRMHEESLRNYASDAQVNNGVMVLNSHDSRQFGFGRSLTGEFRQAAGDEPPQVLSTFYIPRNMTLNGNLSNNDAIAGLRMRVITDVSIGYYGATYQCGLDSLNLFDLDCPHIPGWYYEGDRDEYGNKDGDGDLAFAWVMGARLSEYSLVYKGANPSATIVKLSREQAIGRIQEAQVRLVEAHYKVVPTNRSWSFASAQPLHRVTVEEVRAMKDTPATREDVEATSVEVVADPAIEVETGLQAPEPAPVRAIPEVVPALQVSPPRIDGDDVRIANLLSALNAPGDADESWVVSQFRELTTLAGWGRSWRESLIADALEEGVRANGTAWPVEDFRAILNGLGPDAIKTMAAGWRTQADSILKGGRRTTDAGEQRDMRLELPNSAFTG